MYVSIYKYVRYTGSGVTSTNDYDVHVYTHTDRWSVMYLMIERQLIDRENWNDLW